MGAKKHNSGRDPCVMSQRALIALRHDNLPSQLFVPPSNKALFFFSPFKQVKGPAKYQFKHETKTQCIFLQERLSSGRNVPFPGDQVIFYLIINPARLLHQGSLTTYLKNKFYVGPLFDQFTVYKSIVEVLNSRWANCPFY